MSYVACVQASGKPDVVSNVYRDDPKPFRYPRLAWMQVGVGAGTAPCAGAGAAVVCCVCTAGAGLSPEHAARIPTAVVLPLVAVPAQVRGPDCWDEKYYLQQNPDLK